MSARATLLMVVMAVLVVVSLVLLLGFGRYHPVAGTSSSSSSSSSSSDSYRSEDETESSNRNAPSVCIVQMHNQYDNLDNETLHQMLRAGVVDTNNNNNDNNDDSDKATRRRLQRGWVWMVLHASTKAYARRHGYTYVFYHLPQSGSSSSSSGNDGTKKQKGPCRGPTGNLRSPAWCKLRSIAHALHSLRCRMAVWVDSDASFWQQQVTISQFLQKYDRQAFSKQSQKLPVALSEADVIVPEEAGSANRAMGDMANTCIILMRNSDASWAILRDWWSYTGHWETKHFFEQSPFTSVVIPRHSKHIALVESWPAPLMNTPRGLWMKHFPHWDVPNWMREQLSELSIQLFAYEGIHAAPPLDERHVYWNSTLESEIDQLLIAR